MYKTSHPLHCQKITAFLIIANVISPVITITITIHVLWNCTTKHVVQNDADFWGVQSTLWFGSEAEIYELYIVVFAHHDILRLQIPVDVSLAVDVRLCGEDLPKDSVRFQLLQIFMVGDLIQ